MANIKLTGNTWDTSSVYDKTEGKTQKQINAALASAVSSQAEETTELKTAFSQLMYDAITPVYNTYDGYYINNVGTLSKDNSTHTSDMIEIPSGAKRIYFQNITPENNFACIGFYNASTTPTTSTYVGKYIYSNANKDDTYVEIPAGAKYFVYSYLAADTAGTLMYINSDYIDGITPDQTVFFERDNLFVFDSDVMIGSYYNDQNTLINNASYGSSGFIPVIGGNKYTSAETGFSVNWYDESKAFISATSSITYFSQKYAEAPSSAKYARFIFTVSLLSEFFINCLSDSNYALKSEYDSTRKVEAIRSLNLKGKKWTSFGDSITAQNKWQPIIATALGLIHTNCGVGSSRLSGANVSGSAVSMWQDSRLNAVKTANPNVVTILGGANDITWANAAIGTIAECGYDSPTDAATSANATAYDSSASYSEGDYCIHSDTVMECLGSTTGTYDLTKWKPVKNVNNFFGAYSYIIENLLAWKRTIAIVVCTTTWGENNGIGYNRGFTYGDYAEACREIGNYYGLPCADLYANCGFNKFTMGTGANAVYSADQIHPNGMGASRIAKVVMNTFVGNTTLN